MRDGDAVLIVWAIWTFLWDVLVLGFAANRIFYHGASKWWFLLAMLMTMSGVYDALRKRFNLKEDE